MKSNDEGIENHTQLLHMNVPQLLTHAVQAQDNMLLWGRGTGKTEGAVSLFSLKNILTMPRSNGAFVGATYEQILTRTLPVVIAGWEKFGYIHGVHFFVKRFPPDKWKWPKAYRAPLKPDHYISWFNGSGVYLVSQDRMGTSNGLSLDWVAGDEAKFLNRARLKDELLLTLRGNLSHFGHLSQHYSTMFASDKSRSPKARWMGEIREQMDAKKVDAVIKAVAFLTQHPEKAEAYAPVLASMRKGLTYFSEASTLDNVHALGIGAIKNFKRQLTPGEFDLSVLNLDSGGGENLFYSSFDAVDNTYESADYSHLDAQPLFSVRDCRWDADIAPSPLYIGMDYNAAISTMCVGQKGADGIRVIKNFWVESPKILKDLVKLFHAYYSRLVPRPQLFYIYDHTAVAKNPATQKSFADEVFEEFKRLKWDIRRVYIGQQPGHSIRYDMMAKAFRGELPYVLSLNRANCRELIEAMEQAPLKEGRTGFEKDKSGEKDPNVPPIKATHITDAFDTLVIGMTSPGRMMGGGAVPSGNF